MQADGMSHASAIQELVITWKLLWSWRGHKMPGRDQRLAHNWRPLREHKGGSALCRLAQEICDILRPQENERRD